MWMYLFTISFRFEHGKGKNVRKILNTISVVMVIVYFSILGNYYILPYQNWARQSRVRLVGWLMFYDTFSTNRLDHATEVGNVSHRAGSENKYHAIK